MLIETVDEMNELPAMSVILDRGGNALQTRTDYDLPDEKVQQFLDERGPFTLIHPRRYGDEDVERVAKGLYERACEGRDYDSWEDAAEEARELYLRTARAALDALEEK